MRQPSGQRLIHQHPDAVPVARLRDRTTSCLFRRHVRRRAGDVFGHGRIRPKVPGQTEVHQDDAARRGDHHVRRLDVLVHDAVSMNGGQAVRQATDRTAQAIRVTGQFPAFRLGGDGRPPGGGHLEIRQRRAGPGRRHRIRGLIRPGERHPVLHVPQDRAAFDELHGEEPPIRMRQQLVEGDQVLVRDVAERAEFLLQAVEALPHRGDAAS